MLQEPIRIGGEAIEPMTALVVLAGAAFLVLAGLLIVAIAHLATRSREGEARSAEAGRLQAELAKLEGRLQAVTEISVTRQSELGRAVNDRLDKVSHRLGQNLTEGSRKTSESLAKLAERLAVIDSAQKNITELSSNVVGLQQILANKQARGAFGQGRMEAIIKDGLPKDAYNFQATLANGKRPDCLIRIPGAPPLVIDAKFPLEGFEALRAAKTQEAKKQAAQQIRQHVGHHIEAIGERYLLPGETQDQALMFVPSEAVYADLHEYFAELIQKAHRARVVIVSPNMLMLAVQTMQAILKDVRMREQAGLIQREVAYLITDVARLRERVHDLQRHFGHAGQDIERILTSSEKITKRGNRIETLDFEGEAPPVEAKPNEAKPKAAAKKPAAKKASAKAPAARKKRNPRAPASVPKPPGAASQGELLAGE